jgi:hypothetical protein
MVYQFLGYLKDKAPLGSVVLHDRLGFAPLNVCLVRNYGATLLRVSLDLPKAIQACLEFS